MTVEDIRIDDVPNQIKIELCVDMLTYITCRYIIEHLDDKYHTTTEWEYSIKQRSDESFDIDNLIVWTNSERHPNDSVTINGNDLPHYNLVKTIFNRLLKNTTMSRSSNNESDD